ncbi:non-ribosomal peptide synthetase [Paenibacillus sp. GbtcB18]|uniref:non-ribosomal peptide synthetase n=1 Tax=Paenibacillus sp. GbtcB18 TaxID=2824763 RepID=UPI001C30431E|nr:non-ribosomal peptide synthetase [Paenibacillus sp. GbtcB18]
MSDNHLQNRRESLSPEKRTLLEMKLKGKAVAPRTELPKVAAPPAEDDQTGGYPLSYSQQRLWFFQELFPDSTAYNEAVGMVITGSLHYAALEDSVNQLVKRHAALRTVFKSEDGHAFQIVQPYEPVTIDRIDMKRLMPADRRETVNRVSTEAVNKPFDMAEQFLFRVVLLELSEDEHILLLITHHIISDGWSMGIMFKELCQGYEAALRGMRAQLPALPIQYNQYVSWQKENLQGAKLQKQLDYWRDKLQGIQPTLIPTDMPRPDKPSFNGGTHLFLISASLLERLKVQGRAYGFTLYMQLMTAFHILLHRYTNAEETVVGTPVANRSLKESEGMIGFFVNTLVSRIHLSGRPTFLNVLEQIKQSTIDDLEHQELPFEMLLEELHVERNLNRNPMFQHMFTLQNAPVERIQLPGLHITEYPVQRQSSKFDTWLSVFENVDHLRVILEYATDLFNRETIERMGTHFITIIEAMVSNPKQHIAAFPLVTAGEQFKITQEWNATETVYGGGECLHRLIEDQTDRLPDQEAVVFEGRSWTYSRLNTDANRLARYLRGRGVQAEVPVCICMERSYEMVVSLLAVLKAGGAYVPIDPGYPRERIAYIQADSGASLTLTQRGIAERFGWQEPGLLRVDEAAGQWAAEAGHNLADADTGGDGLAYIIYTSGSTGQPKGAMNTHRGVCNRLKWMQEKYQLSAADRVLQKTPFGFDVSVWEFFWPLMTGAALVLARPEGHKDSEYLAELIREKRITTLHFVPSMLQVFLEERGLAAGTGRLRQIFCSGEALPYELMERTRMKLSHVALHNLYGPTEAAIDVTYHPCEVSEVRRTVPIGRPIANMRMYILDDEMNVVPAGVKGELYIGGPGIARGYYRRPGLTAEKFVPNPYCSVPGERLYRTGDIGWYRSDGEIEYAGRKDDQIKIRGFRVEHGEIEAALSGYEEVREATVMVKEDERGKRLIAYVVGKKEGEPVNSAQVRTYLSGKLPEYMVPAGVVTLAEMPLSANGKLDRKGLPEPGELLAAEREQQYAAPENEAQRVIAEVWQDVLKLDRIGIHDNFFALVGDSILSIQAVSRLKNLGYSLSPKDLVAHQTISELAKRAEKKVEGSLSLPYEAASDKDYPLTPIQQWFFRQPILHPNHYNQSLWLAVRQPLNIGALNQALAYVVSRNYSLRTQFIKHTSWVSRVGPFEAATIVEIDLSDMDSSTRDLKIAGIAYEAAGSLELSAGQLIRVLHFSFGGDEPERLLLIVHHLAVDGVSWRILLRQLEQAYFHYDQQAELSERQVLPYSVIAEELYKSVADGEWRQRLEREKAYWLSETLQEKAAAANPWRTGGDASNSTIASLVRFAGQQDTQYLLKELPKLLRMRMDEVLLAALGMTLHCVLGKDAFIIDLERHGRDSLLEELDLSDNVGWFTSIFPFLLERPPGLTPKDWLIQVKEQMRKVPGQGTGYGVLKYIADLTETEASRLLPDGAICFNYLGQVDSTDSKLFALMQDEHDINKNHYEYRKHVLEINARLVDGSLQTDWIYAEQSLSEYEAITLADMFSQSLGQIIAFCKGLDGEIHTPADFPLADINEDQLKKIAELLAIADGRIEIAST